MYLGAGISHDSSVIADMPLKIIKWEEHMRIIFNQITPLIVSLSLLVSSITFAHSGGTDSNGCHTNHSTNEYHCHNSKDSNSKEATTALAIIVVGGLIYWYFKDSDNKQSSYHLNLAPEEESSPYNMEVEPSITQDNREVKVKFSYQY
ncbi:YHYH domain-containing protein [Endozoicomonas acroporae]|uniref:YHYH domain-containing protein n=1 Tax=Endozoicomonas acroporae TaxID=1701104 RepID=UPI003D7A55AE